MWYHPYKTLYSHLVEANCIRHILLQKEQQLFLIDIDMYPGYGFFFSSKKGLM